MTTFSRRVVGLAASLALAAGVVVAHGAEAQSATGTITGRVLWGTCFRAIPFPAQPGAPEEQRQPTAPLPNGLPAGAVLVAVQSTAISTRTDDAGTFTLSEVPAGQYLTVAAGPVANAPNAVAERPNVFVNAGQSVDLGTLSLGGSLSPAGVAGVGCRPLPLPAGAVDGGAPADSTPAMPEPPETAPSNP
jgi:hypothetical protein